MVMGNSYFTNSPPTHPGDNAEVDKEAASGKRGSFSWSLQSVTRGLEGQDTGETGFYYEESPLSCNVGLFFHWNRRHLKTSFHISMTLPHCGFINN
jgi:hypothetical protein